MTAKTSRVGILLCSVDEKKIPSRGKARKMVARVIARYNHARANFVGIFIRGGKSVR